MQRGLSLIVIAIAALAPSVAFAADVVRRPVCPKVEPQRVAPPQQRTRTQDCRSTRPVPPVVDPTPFFLL